VTDPPTSTQDELLQSPSEAAHLPDTSRAGAPPRPSIIKRSFAAIVGLYAAHLSSSALGTADIEALRKSWIKQLGPQTASTLAAESIRRAYDGAVERGIRVEAKAIGYLQVIAIAFAIVAIIVPNDSIWLRIVCLASVAFLCAAVWGAMDILRVRSRQQLMARDATSASGGIVETAVAAESMEMEHTRSSNYAAGARRDLVTGGGLAVVALAMATLGVG